MEYLLPIARSQDSTISNGTLFNLCDYCKSNYQKKTCQKFYKQIEDIGVSKCPYGYSVYSFLVGDSFYHFTGLRTESSDLKKLKTGKRLPLKFLNDQDFIEYEKNYKIFLKDFRQIREYRKFIHDARNINSQVKGQLDFIRDSTIADSVISDHIKRRLDSVWHASSMLTSRMDYLKYILNPKSVRLSDISIHGKCLKAMKIFLPSARDKQLDYFSEKLGSSFSSVLAHEFIEMIPMLLIENAIKYSPEGGSINLKIREEKNRIIVKFSNLGPLVGNDEIEDLMKIDVRGKGAVDSDIEGDGKGLSIVSELCQLYQIDLELSLGDEVKFKDKVYQYFYVTLRMSINNKNYFAEKKSTTIEKNKNAKRPTKKYFNIKGK